MHPGPGLTQPSILSGSVNEYRLRSGRYKGRYVLRCSVRAMYLSASAVAGKPNSPGRYNKCSTFTFTIQREKKTKNYFTILQIYINSGQERISYGDQWNILDHMKEKCLNN